MLGSKRGSGGAAISHQRSPKVNRRTSNFDYNCDKKKGRVHVEVKSGAGRRAGEGGTGWSREVRVLELR